jgi:hypothetical protein
MNVSKASIPPDVLHRLRLICLDLPEALEEPAWTGIRWCIDRKNFTHVLIVADGWPPAYARAAGINGPACVLTFRHPSAKLYAPRFASAPFFRPAWWPNIAGMILSNDTDWEEVGELILESYRLLMPRRLASHIQS